MSYALEVHDLWKSYAVGVRGCSARVSVLRGVSLRVGHGERLGIVGAAGAGKTTLAHCILGYRRPDAGYVRAAAHAAPTGVIDGETVLGAPHAGPPAGAVLLLARGLDALRARVDRVLLLRDGCLVPLDPVGTPAVRRVAEGRARRPGDAPSLR